MELGFSVVKLTAEFARAALDNQEANRVLSRDTVGKYKRDMLAGAFVLNGEPVVFNQSGRLADGQHRMAAFLEAVSIDPNVVVHVCVVRGAPNDAKYNQCRPRSVSDQCAINGIANGKKVVSVCALVMAWDDLTGFPDSFQTKNTPTFTEVEKLLRNDPSILEATRSDKDYKMLYSPSASGFLQWLFSRIPGGMQWLDSVVVGADLSATSPAFLLRSWLLNFRAGKNTFTTQWNVRNVMSISATIKAWNATVTGQTLGVIRPSTERKFPVPIGLTPRS